MRTIEISTPSFSNRLSSADFSFISFLGAKHPNFKQISKLVIDHMKLPNEFNDPLKK